MWFWKSKPKYGGLIAGHDLHSWWDVAFTDEERTLIRAQLDRPFSLMANIDDGAATNCGMSAKAALASLAQGFEKDDVRHLGRRIMAQAETLSSEGMDVLDLHFMLGGMVKFYYRCRKDGPEFVPLCAARCRDMIAISGEADRAMRAQWPKTTGLQHIGYGRLSWLLRKTDPAESARLREEGEAQGWTVSI